MKVVMKSFIINAKIIEYSEYEFRLIHKYGKRETEYFCESFDEAYDKYERLIRAKNGKRLE